MKRNKAILNKIGFTTVVLFIMTQLFAQDAYFVKNQGQVVDQEGNFNQEVAFVLSLKEYNVSFYADHFSYELFTQNKEDTTLLNVERIELWFNKPNALATIVANEEANEKLNSYKNGKSFTDISSFKKITYNNIWEGVDIEFLIHNNQLKYNYIVANQQKKSLSLTVKGAKMEIESGNVLFKTAENTLKETIPESYFLLANNDKKRHDVRLKTNGNVLTFLLPDNRQSTYVIDPIAYGNEYTSYYGGAHMDFAQSINTTKTNQVIVSGYTVSANNIATVGAFKTTLSDQDAFIAAFNQAGTRLWATYFGGPDQERCYSAALDTNDNIFIAGNTTSAMGIGTPGAYQQFISAPGGDDAFIAKFSPTGTLVWSTYYGGNAHELITAISLDDSNKVYVTGHTSSTDLACTPDAFRNTVDGYENAFLGVFKNNGAVIYNSYYVKGNNTRGEAISIAKNGTIYLAGYTNDTNPTSFPSVHQSTNAGYLEGFIIKLNPEYQMIWKTYIGGEQNDLIQGMVLDTLENIYVVGKTKSSTGIATSNGLQPTYESNWDGFVLKLDSSSTRKWGTYIHAGGNDELTAIQLRDSSIWLLGYSNGSSLPVSPSAIQATNKGGFDNILLNLSDTGGLIWASYLGGENDEFGYDITISKSNKILLTGQTGSTSNLTTPNAHQQTYGGHIYDGFWTVLCEPTHPTVLSQNGTINLCDGDVVTINSTNSFNTYLWSNGATTNNVTLSTAGKYVLKTTDANNCPGRSDTVTINKIIPLQLQLQTSKNVICFEDSVQLSLNTPYVSYVWNDGSTLATLYVLDEQPYYLTAIDSYGCSHKSDTLQLSFAQYSYPVQLIGDTIICAGGSSILYTSGLHSILWNTSQTTQSITVSNSGDYYFTALDANSCPVISDTITITQISYNSPSLVLNSPSSLTVCSTDSVVLTAENDFVSYAWSNGVNSQSITLKETGFYYVSVTDTNGCVGISDTVSVIKLTIPTVQIIGSLDTLCLTDTLILTTSTSLSQYNWSNGSAAATNYYIPTLLGENTLTLIGTGSNSCQNSDTITVTVIDCTPYASIEDQKEELITLTTSNNELTVTALQLIKNLTLLDLNGKVLIQKENMSTLTGTLNHQNLTPSIYLLKIELVKNNRIVIKKIKLIE